MDDKLDLLLKEIHEIKTTMATKQDVEIVNVKLDKLSESIEKKHIENVNSDNLLLKEIQSLREGVVFVNRKVADAELEISMMKQRNQ
ncbi:hypothetical protein [Bacillus dakarensis]|uniref:hypothetical protein n=1 Tax=Robertmurraya dakarensis TaxID=1926278 RepID=UPI000981E84B|nr:hypothetical protein [Bacillus dakarensis]